MYSVRTQRTAFSVTSRECIAFCHLFAIHTNKNPIERKCNAVMCAHSSTHTHTLTFHFAHWRVSQMYGPNVQPGVYASNDDNLCSVMQYIAIYNNIRVYGARSNVSPMVSVVQCCVLNFVVQKAKIHLSSRNVFHMNNKR